MTVGKYQIVNPNDATSLPDTHKITVRVIFFVPFLSYLFSIPDQICLYSVNVIR